jgi:hypothetical protein
MIFIVTWALKPFIIVTAYFDLVMSEDGIGCKDCKGVKIKGKKFIA